MQVGTLPKKEFVIGGIFDDELFAEVREKKLATLLATEVIEGEVGWLCYEFEEAQVKIDLGDMILEHLVSETIEILDAIMSRRVFNECDYKSIYVGATDFQRTPIISGAQSIQNSEEDEFE
jgi:hypothetical protein